MANLARPCRRGVDATTTEPLTGATVRRLNDQHAFVDLEAGVHLAIGDLIGFGISHPCSAFDRWRAIPVVDAEDRVLDVYETIF